MVAIVTIVSYVYFTHRHRINIIQFVLVNHENIEIVSGRLGYNTDFKDSSSCLFNDEASVCLKWRDHRQLIVRKSQKNNVNCLNVQWILQDCNFFPKDCYHLAQDKDYWFGGNEFQGFIPFFAKSYKNYIVSPTGAVFVLDKPLGHAVAEPNKNRLCLKSKAERVCDSKSFNLTYSLCVGPSIQQKLLNNSQKIENQLRSLMRKPIYELPSISKEQYTTNRIKNYTEIYSLKPGYLLINESYQKNIGDFIFDSDRFDRNALTNISHTFSIIVTIQPFISTESVNFAETADGSLLISDSYGQPLLTSYNAIRRVGILDSSNNASMEWLMSKLNNLKKEYNVSSFYLDLPLDDDFPHFITSPSKYKSILLDAIQNKFDLFEVNNIIVPPKPPTLMSLPKFERSWKGLRQIIPTMLTYSQMGFKLVVSGAIGGDYLPNNSSQFDPELYIKWLQLATFFPIIKFSLLSNATMFLRENSVIQKHNELFTNSTFATIRPLFALDDTDQTCFSILDQFVVGNDLIIAPILYPKTKTRMIYLPSGTWKDLINGQIYSAKSWISYDVQTDYIPQFKRVKIV